MGTLYNALTLLSPTLRSRHVGHQKKKEDAGQACRFLLACVEQKCRKILNKSIYLPYHTLALLSYVYVYVPPFFGDTTNQFFKKRGFFSGRFV